DGKRLFLVHAAGAAADLAGFLDHPAHAAAGRAAALDGEEALLGADLAMALAGRAGDRLRAGLGAGAVAGLAGNRRGHADLGRLALEAVFQRDLEIVAQVGTAIGARAPAAGAAAHELAEQVGEDVGTRREVEAGTGTAAPSALERGMAVLVVGRALLVVLEDVVGLVDFLELLLGLLVARIAIRVILHGQLAVGFFQVFSRGVAAHAQKLVIVAVCRHET